MHRVGQQANQVPLMVSDFGEGGIGGCCGFLTVSWSIEVFRLVQKAFSEGLLFSDFVGFHHL